MKAEFEMYLGALDLPDAIFNRIEIVYSFFQSICPDEINDIFVTDYIKEDRSREYESLWFFSEKYMMEAKEFITSDDYDITPIKNRVTYLQIIKENYDFHKASQSSRINIDFRLNTSAGGMLKAAGENCDYLRDLFYKYIKTNLMV